MKLYRKICNNAYARAKILVEDEYHRISLWYYVSFLFGIALYFAMTQEPKMNLVVYTLILSTAMHIFLRRYASLYVLLSGIIAFFALGIFVAKYRASTINTTAITKPISAFVDGEIIGIKQAIGSLQITLSNLQFNKPMPKIQNIKFNAPLSSSRNIMIGDRIHLFLHLRPPSRSIIPGGYDFGLYAYFSSVGAVGYSISEIEKTNIAGENNKQIRYSFESYLQNIRRTIYHRLIDVMGDDSGNFAAAILLGEGGGLKRNIMQNMRLAGISHILCVSGLHLSLVAGIIFTFIRGVLNLSDAISFRFDVKSLSAVISLVDSFIYLLLSGMQIAATRAFIMTAIMIFSVILGRKPYPLRSMGIAMMVILTMNPEYALHPSFQLSFVAVLSLIAGYEFYKRYQEYLYGKNSSIFNAIKAHIISNIYSSLVASLATTPIVMYHFYISSNYSILANLVAVPMMSFFMMPMVLIALLLMPIGLDYYILRMICYAANIVIKVADYVVNMPYSVWYCGYITAVSLVIFMLGFFWLSLWQKKWRYFGFIIILFSMFLMSLSPKPDLIFDPHFNAIGIKNDKNELEIYTKYLPKFTQNFWTNWYGQEKVITYKQNITEQNHELTTSNMRKIKILYSEFDCNADAVLNLIDERKCPNIPSLSLKEMMEYGTILVFCNESLCSLKYKDSKRFSFKLEKVLE